MFLTQLSVVWEIELLTINVREISFVKVNYSKKENRATVGNRENPISVECSIQRCV